MAISTQLFRLLDLPGELRNNIYEKVLEDTVTKINKHNNALINSSAVLCVNHQVKDEYLKIMYSTANVHFIIHDFDFSSLVNFLASLSQEQIAAFETKASFSITTELTFDDEDTMSVDSNDPTWNELENWLSRRSNSQDHISKVKIDYEATFEDFLAQEDFMEVMEEAEARVPGNAIPEFSKIKKAIDEGWYEELSEDDESDSDYTSWDSEGDFDDADDFFPFW